MNETQASQLPVYAGNDLGAVWRSSATAFRLWAPTAADGMAHLGCQLLVHEVELPGKHSFLLCHNNSPFVRESPLKNGPLQV